MRNRLGSLLLLGAWSLSTLLVAGCPGTGTNGDDPPECQTDTDCAESEVCTNGSCVEDMSVECTTQPQCALGTECVDGACETVDGADLQYLVTTDGVSEVVMEGDQAPVFRGFQGGVHTFVTIRMTGFQPEENIVFTISITRAEDGSNLATERTFSSVPTTDIGSGVNEAVDLFIAFDLAGPGDLIDVPAVVDINVSSADETVSASVTAGVVLTEVDE
ncbi:MAG: hypothetical protein ACYTHJ_19235 [Planctomycetota bacterium]|jgi:hypothetical protein